GSIVVPKAVGRQTGICIVAAVRLGKDNRVAESATRVFEQSAQAEVAQRGIPVRTPLPGRSPEICLRIHQQSDGISAFGAGKFMQHGKDARGRQLEDGSPAEMTI